MPLEQNFSFERFEEYYGDIKQVRRILDECNICGSQLILSHLSDYKNLIVQETAKCPDCGSNNHNKIHILN